MNALKENDLGKIKKQINSLTKEVTSQQENIISSLNTLLKILSTLRSPGIKVGVKEADLVYDIKNIVQSVQNSNDEIKTIIGAIDL